MKRIFGILFVVMTVVALIAIPAAVSAEALPTPASGWEMVKWQDNPNSCSSIFRLGPNPD
jgi:hypothetical protein